MNAVLSLDPAFANTGYVVFHTGQPIAHGVIETAKESKKRAIYSGDDDARRIRMIAERIRELVRQYDVKVITCESPAGAQNANAAKALAYARAIPTVVACMLDLDIITVQPNDTKTALSNVKNADKDVIEAAVAALYPGLAAEYRASAASIKAAATKNAKNPAKAKPAPVYNGVFEHVADAVGVYHAAKKTQFAKSLGIV